MVAPPAEATVTIIRRGTDLNVPLNLDLAEHTPSQVIAHLISEGKLLAQSPEGETLVYALAKANGDDLPADEPLGRQGVKAGDTLQVLCKNIKG